MLQTPRPNHIQLFVIAENLSDLSLECQELEIDEQGRKYLESMFNLQLADWQRFEKILYDPGWRLEKGTLFEADKFDVPAWLAETMKPNPNLATFKLPYKGRIRAICGASRGKTKDGKKEPDRYYLQALTEASIIRKATKREYFFSGDSFKQVKEDTLVLGNRVDAIIEGKSLWFKNLPFVHALFDMKDVVDEATQPMVEKLLSCGHFAGISSFEEFYNTLDSAMKKKVSQILHHKTLEHTGVDPEAIRKTCAEFGAKLELDADGRLVLPGKRAELKHVLQILAHDHYKTRIGEQHHLSNSHRRMR